PEQRPVVLQFCSGGLEGALYYAADGAPRDALALLDAEAGGRPIRLTFDVRRRRGILAVCAIHRALGGGTPERVY
ncbi:MAG: hypothetical protein IJI26_13215, partial [Clostridia bacterium]|nr:hypothetical protein [Clostridia bacterium]